MGGEKLKYRYTALAAAVFFTVFSAKNPYILSAQEIPLEEGAEQELAEEAVTGQRINPESLIFLNDPDLPAENAGNAGTSSVWLMIRMVLVLALAALSIYGLVFFVKRLAKPKSAANPHLKVLATAIVSNDTFAAVLSVGSKAWLVGGGGGSLSLIAEIDEQEALESMLIDEAENNTAAGNGFMRDFRKLLERFSGSKPKAPPDLQNNTFEFHIDGLRKQRDRLGGR